jgi:hypothetical protein
MTQPNARAFTNSDDDRRDGQLRRQGIQTDQFPTAVFNLTSPIDLGSVPVDRLYARLSGHRGSGYAAPDVDASLFPERSDLRVSVASVDVRPEGSRPVALDRRPRGTPTRSRHSVRGQYRCLPHSLPPRA